MTWAETVIPDGAIGFVYLIENLQSGRKYIGRKQLVFKKTKLVNHVQKNGKVVKKKVVTKAESDWKTYWGSCKELLQAIERLGEEQFSRKILHFCYSKSELSYMEAREQFDRRVLEDPMYYNGNIQYRGFKRK